MRAFWANWWSTLREIFGDMTTSGLMVAGCVVYSFFYLFPYEKEYVREVPIAVVDGDGSSASRELRRGIAALPDVKVARLAESRAEAEAMLRRGEIHGIVEVPAGFQADVMSARGGVVVVMDDGSYPVRHRAIFSSVSAVVNAYGAEARGKLLAQKIGAGTVASRKAGEGKPPAVIVEYLFNETGGYASYVVPTVLLFVVQVMQMAGIASMMGARLERRKLYPEGGRRRSFWGTLMAQWLVVWLSTLYVTGIGLWKSDLPTGGEPWEMIYMAGFFAGAMVPLAAGLGLLIGERVRSLQVLLVTTVPFLFLSGFAFPREAMPKVLWWLGELLPSTPGIHGFMKISQMQGGWDAARVEVLTLGAQGLAYLLFAWVVWRWRERELILEGSYEDLRFRWGWWKKSERSEVRVQK